jgi:Fic family protein
MSDSHLTNGTAGATIFSRILESSQEGISPELARYILGLGFSTEDRSRMRELAAKNQRGEISHQELEELDNYITAGDILAIWHSKARRALKQCPASSPRHG